MKCGKTGNQFTHDTGDVQLPVLTDTILQGVGDVRIFRRKVVGGIHGVPEEILIHGYMVNGKHIRVLRQRQTQCRYAFEFDILPCFRNQLQRQNLPGNIPGIARPHRTRRGRNAG